MSPYEEMNQIAKQISEVHKEIAKLYQRMSQRNDEYFWTSIERTIENEKNKAKELRQKLKDTAHKFVNWQDNKEPENG